MTAMLHQSTNQRDFFRLSLPEVPGTLRVIEIGGRPITTEPKPCQLIDASGSGLCLICQEDLPIRKGVVALFEFELLQVQFAFRGTFVRKVDDLQKFEYGVRFVDIDERPQGQLVSVLGRLQVARHRGVGVL